jgi:hypothetical protein
LWWLDDWFHPDLLLDKNNNYFRENVQPKWNDRIASSFWGKNVSFWGWDLISFF